MVFKAARCPNCGGDLQVPEDRTNLKCMYCGSDIVVREAIQAAGGIDTNNLFDLAKTAGEAGNHREAYDYYTRVLELEPQKYEAWLGKAEAAGWMSTLATFRMQETLSGITKAMECAPENKKTEATERSVDIINSVAVSFFGLARLFVF